MSNEPDALRLAKGLRGGTLLLSERDEAAEVLERLHAEVKDWSDRACNLQHELNVALRERDQARFDLQAVRKSLQNHADLALADTGLLREALHALRVNASWPFPKKREDAIAALRKRLGE